MVAVVLGNLIGTERAPVILRGDVAAASAVVITVVCVVAAWLPYWRIRNIDPASVLRN